MKPKTKSVALLIGLLCLLCACVPGNVQNPTTQADYETPEPYTLLTFGSHDELVEYANDEKNEHTLGYYYQPKLWFDGMKFAFIYFVPDVYIAGYYKLESEFSKNFKETSYERERTGLAIYEVGFYSDVNHVIKEDVINRGFEPIEYEGRIYYYYPEYSTDDEKILIGHSIEYITAEGDLMYVHLPAIDSIENMLKYAEAERVYIK